MNKKTHRHRSLKSEDWGFAGPVSKDENPAAHGNICQVDTCKCGAVRRTNINGQHREMGKWETTPVPVKKAEKGATKA